MFAVFALVFLVSMVCLAGATGFNTSFVKNIPAKPKEPLNSNSIKPNTTRRPVWHLYGVFQLSDQLACDSGMNPSLNVCNTSCTAFTDDDVTDDIACLNTIISSIVTLWFPLSILWSVRVEQHRRLEQCCDFTLLTCCNTVDLNQSTTESYRLPN
uniref:Lysozyme n=1 Tax=Cyprinus carpio TaxID=7962 RepID=A0A8C1RYD9_CYPCA